MVSCSRTGTPAGRISANATDTSADGPATFGLGLVGLMWLQNLKGSLTAGSRTDCPRLVRQRFERLLRCPYCARPVPVTRRSTEWRQVHRRARLAHVPDGAGDPGSLLG